MTKCRLEILRHVFNILMLLVASSLSSCVTARSTYDNRPQKIIIIYYDSEIGNKRLLKAAGKYGSEVLYVYKIINGIAVTVPKGKTTSDAMIYYGKVKGVLSVAEDRKMRLY